MSTLLEKPPETSSPAHHPTRLLHSRHRWERWRGVLTVLLGGLCVTLAALIVFHPSWQIPTNGKTLAAIWTGGILLTVILAYVAWRFAPASLADTAQDMDRRLAAKNRLEAAASLHHSTSPLALAQREETTAYLQGQPQARPVRMLPWLAGGVLVLAIAHLFTLAIWVLPALLRPPTPVPPPPPKELPKASIVWKSPEPESTANPVEEVPTVAVAQSTCGLRDLSLEISVNGEFKKSTPIPDKPYDQPGTAPIKVSIYMDELEVEPYDVVSYFIRAQRIVDQKVPDTASAIQFIEVRPFRDDVRVMPPGQPHKNYDLLIRLKLAQLKAIKENFILTHTELAVTDPVRMKENDRVGKNQGDLAAKTEEVVQAFIQDGVSPAIIDLLKQAEAPMTDASKKILATQNAQALPPQEKALSLIVEVEKYFIKIMGQPKPGPQSSNPEDPFKSQQQHEMKKRFETAAGQLEQLAKNQAKLAQDISRNDSSGQGQGSPSPGTGDTDKNPATPSSGAPSPGSGQPSPGTTTDESGKTIPLPTPQSVDPFSPNAEKGTFAERQTRILQGVEALLDTNNVLPATVNDALQDAKTHATESLHQLDQGNQPDAREPSSLAAQDLQRAVDEMNKAGEQETKLAMEQAQHRLNELARQLSDLAKTGAPGSHQQDLSNLAAQTRDVQKQLNDASDRQQEAGSSSGAHRLDELAKQIGDQKIEHDLNDMAKTGLDPLKANGIAKELANLAGEAVQGQTAGKPTAADLTRLLTALEKTRANLARITGQEGGPGVQPGQTPGQGQDQHPGTQPGQGEGQQPGKQSGQGQQAQGQSETPNSQHGMGQGQGEGQGPNPNPQKQGQGPGQGENQNPQQQGQGQAVNPNPQHQGQGQGQGENPNPQQQGQGQDPSQNPDSQKDQGQGEGQGQGNGTAKNSDINPPQPGEPNGTGGSGTSGSGVEGEYHEVMADLRDETQEVTVMAPALDTTKLRQNLDDQHFRETDVGNAVRAYQAIALPLDKLITDLTALVSRSQRENIVKKPDLDEAPPAYRPAVSDYFEDMSRDYHPDGGDDATKKP